MQLLLLSFFLGITACSHSQSLGEEMIIQGEQAEKLGKKWNNGENLIKKGEKEIRTGEANIKKGEKLIHKGKAQIHDGNSKINKGRHLIEKTEHNFHDQFPEVQIGKQNS